MLKSITFLMLSIMVIFANNLDSKIEALYKAPKEKRYKIMNEIKRELIKLNRDQREHFLQKLLNKSNNNSMHKNRYRKHYNNHCVGEFKHKKRAGEGKKKFEKNRIKTKEQHNQDHNKNNHNKQDKPKKNKNGNMHK